MRLLKTSVTPSEERMIITPSSPPIPSTARKETASSPGKSG